MSAPAVRKKPDPATAWLAIGLACWLSPGLRAGALSLSTPDLFMIPRSCAPRLVYVTRVRRR